MKLTAIAGVFAGNIHRTSALLFFQRNGDSKKVLKLLRLMKLIVLLLFAGTMTVSARVGAQNLTLSLSDVSIEKAFNEIRKQTGYTFFYNDKTLAGAKKVTIQVSNASLDKVLQICFAGQPLIYTIFEKVIVIKEKNPAVAGDEKDEVAPVMDVRGRVMNEKGEPVDGATIIVKGNEKKGAVSDAGGFFEIKGIDPGATLVVSGVNIESKEVVVNGKTDLTTILVKHRIVESGAVLIDANTGYQKIKPNESTGSMSVIDKSLLDLKVGPGILDRLDGVTTGILFDRRKPDETRIQVRGLYTLTNSISQPLIIVNNFPYEGDINNINPNDVESVTILKDAAAASIWGAKAGNGVIVITTKKGQYNQPVRVSFNSNYTISKRPDLFSSLEMSPSDYIDVETFLFSQGAYDAEIGFPEVPLSPLVQVLDQHRNSLITDDELAAIVSRLRNQDVRNDFEKYLYRDATHQQYAVSVSGGARNVNYFFSAGYDKDISSQQGNESNRISFRSDNTFMILPGLQVRAALGYTQANGQNNSPGGLGNWNLGSGRRLPLYSQLADANGNPLAIDIGMRPEYLAQFGNGLLRDWSFRPLDELANNNRRSVSHSIIGELNLKYDITRYLSAQVLYTYIKTIGISNDYYNVNTYTARNLINRFTQVNGNEITYIVPNDGMLDYSNRDIQNQGTRGQLNFNKSWGLKHVVTALAGAEVREDRVTANGYRTYGYNDRLGVSNIDAVNPYPVITGGEDYIPGTTNLLSESVSRFVSVYANAAYTFSRRYTFSGSVRRDASNLFGVSVNNKWKPQWSAGAAWKLSEEDFYHLEWLPTASLRATYGFAGNVNNSLAAVTTLTYYPASFQFYTALPMAAVNTRPNPDLTWEKVRQFNVGFDFATKDSRFAGSIDYYSKKSLDLIGYRQMDPTSGVPSMNVNSASILGNGLELLLNAMVFKTGSFQWNTSLSLTYANYKLFKYMQPITRLGFVSDGGDIVPLVGQNPYVVVSYKWAGLDPANGDPLGYFNDKVSNRWDSIVRFTPLEQLDMAGSALPVYFGNFRNVFTYKGISLATIMTYELKYFFRRSTINYSLLESFGQGHADYLRRWQQPGDEAFTDVPSFIYPSPSDFRNSMYANSAATVEKGDHIRLNDIMLSYTLKPKSKQPKPVMASVQFYVYATNLNAIIWKANDAGLDPKYPNGFKPPRSFSFGIRAEF